MPRGYIFLSVNFENGIPIDGRAIKANSQLKVIDVIHRNLFEEESFKRFMLWIEGSNEYRIVSLKHKSFSAFVQHVEKNAKITSKDDVRMLKSSFWNMYNEILYNLKCPQKFSIEQLLKLYRINPLIHEDPLMAECLNLSLLANAYLFDKKTTNEIKEKGYLEVLRQHLNKQSVDSLILQAIHNGWAITFGGDSAERVELTAQRKHSSDEKRLEGNAVRDALVNFHLSIF